jgi:hypothetical protein
MVQQKLRTEFQREVTIEEMARLLGVPLPKAPETAINFAMTPVNGTKRLDDPNVVLTVTVTYEEDYDGQVAG